MTLTYLSLFAGVGGADLGCDAAGWECVGQVEIDPWCQQVLNRHWPEVPKWSDVSDFHGSEAPADVVVFGAPCQGLSSAGQRKGLADPRSGLFFEATRIIKEMRDATGEALPRWAVYENVPGALSSAQGDDWAAVLDALGECGAVDLQWRVLDARFFGVPQRRRRVFLLACFDPRAVGDEPVLPVPTGVRRDPHQGVKARAVTAGSLTQGLGSGGPDAAWAQAGWLIPVEDGVVIEPYVKSHRAASNTDYESWRADDVIPTLNAFDQGDTRATAVFAVSITPESGQGADLRAVEIDQANALSATDAKMHDRGTRIVTAIGVRRLTPRECERLQGWPDDHTALTPAGARIADTNRYKMCGNGIASPVMRWVAEQITRREDEWTSTSTTS